MLSLAYWIVMWLPMQTDDVSIYDLLPLVSMQMLLLGFTGCGRSVLWLSPFPLVLHHSFSSGYCCGVLLFEFFYFPHNSLHHYWNGSRATHSEVLHLLVPFSRSSLLGLSWNTANPLICPFQECKIWSLAESWIQAAEVARSGLVLVMQNCCNRWKQETSI